VLTPTVVADLSLESTVCLAPVLSGDLTPSQ
jgi:hypothetical protein